MRIHNLVGPKTIRWKESKRNEYSTNEYRHEAIDHLDELKRLVALAPSDLKEDLEAMLEYEETYDPTTATEVETDTINLIGFRVGAEMENRCGVQLPGIR